MTDIIDQADNTIEQNLQQALANKAPGRPHGMEPTGECHECGAELELPGQLFCAAEPGQRESDCIKRWNQRQHQKRVLGR